MLSTQRTQQPVIFDPTNQEHVLAFAALTQKNRQHPTLRFILELPYMDIRTMMHAKVGEEFAKRMGVLDHVDTLFARAA
jgi:hypothetical protein